MPRYVSFDAWGPGEDLDVVPMVCPRCNGMGYLGAKLSGTRQNVKCEVERCPVCRTSGKVVEVDSDGTAVSEA